MNNSLTKSGLSVLAALLLAAAGCPSDDKGGNTDAGLAGSDPSAGKGSGAGKGGASGTDAGEGSGGSAGTDAGEGDAGGSDMAGGSGGGGTSASPDAGTTASPDAGTTSSGTITGDGIQWTVKGMTHTARAVVFANGGLFFGAYLYVDTGDTTKPPNSMAFNVTNKVGTYACEYQKAQGIHLEWSEPDDTRTPAKKDWGANACTITVTKASTGAGDRIEGTFSGTVEFTGVNPKEETMITNGSFRVVQK